MREKCATVEIKILLWFHDCVICLYCMTVYVIESFMTYISWLKYAKVTTVCKPKCYSNLWSSDANGLPPVYKYTARIAWHGRST